MCIIVWGPLVFGQLGYFLSHSSAHRAWQSLRSQTCDKILMEYLQCLNRLFLQRSDLNRVVYTLCQTSCLIRHKICCYQVPGQSLHFSALLRCLITNPWTQKYQKTQSPTPKPQPSNKKGSGILFMTLIAETLYILFELNFIVLSKNISVFHKAGGKQQS